MGMGWTYPTLALPIPLVRVGRLPAKSFMGFVSEIELRSTVTDTVDLAFHDTQVTQQTRQDMLDSK